MVAMQHLWRAGVPRMRVGCLPIWRRAARRPSRAGGDFMAMDAGMIEKLIREGIPDAQVSIEDLRGDGDHYAAYVVSPAFKGKSRIQQHQMVYQALRGKMGGELHALALQTSAPAEA